MTTTEEEIRHKTDEFINDLGVLIRAAALETVTTALKAPPAPPPPIATPIAPKKAAQPKSAPAPIPVPAKKSAKTMARPPGVKRSPAELADAVEKLAALVKASPGQQMEVLSKALGTSTTDATLPMKKLLAAKRVRFEGVKRATKYYPT